MKAEVQTMKNKSGLTAIKKKDGLRWLWKSRYLYLLLVPVVVFYILFKYVPLYGLLIAFKDYKFATGILGSPWAGFKYFEEMFRSGIFYTVLRNTLLLNVYSVVFGFPVPIILALLINEMKHQWYKRVVQQLIYIPHFFSWVVLGGMIVSVLSPRAGAVNFILERVIGQKIFFMASDFWWPVVFILSGIWKEAGWGTIIYLAAISGVDTQLYESAIIDGANKFKQVLHITIPSIKPTIIILLVLRLGYMMDVGFEQVFMLQNNAVMQVADVISTYVYRMGIMGYQYSATTAIGIFQSLVSVVLLVTANKLSNKFAETGIW